ncbi:MAG: hypothetical protein J7K00_04165 [Candidatus Diapherotrites archaeon]|nr:hypothetical protein [Candidatus Diapherotrites archaeon]
MIWINYCNINKLMDHPLTKIFVIFLLVLIWMLWGFFFGHCQTYEIYDNATGTCFLAPGKCNIDSDCGAGQKCLGYHKCLNAPEEPKIPETQAVNPPNSMVAPLITDNEQKTLDNDQEIKPEITDTTTSIEGEIVPITDEKQEKLKNILVSGFESDTQNDETHPCTPTFKVKNNNSTAVELNIIFSTQNSSESAKAGWDKAQAVQLSLNQGKTKEIKGEIYAPTITHYPYECWIIQDSITIEVL